MLQTRIQAIPGLNGSHQGTCLYAVTYWLYEDLHGIGPSQTTMQDIQIRCSFNRIFTEMIQLGRQVTRPMFGGLKLTPGNVLIFQKNGGVGRACVVKDATHIGGYNQTNWFSTPGITHTYTEHHPNDIAWRGATHPHQVNVNVVLPPFPAQPMWGKLYQIDQSKARDILFRHIKDD